MMMADLNLTPEQEAEAQRLAEIIAQKTKEEALRMARLLVSKKDHEILGATEFEIRDRVHKIGAHAIETALNERKKGGTKGRA
jgi:plasmid stabilization system protein ParE